MRVLETAQLTSSLDTLGFRRWRQSVRSGFQLVSCHFLFLILSPAIVDPERVSISAGLHSDHWVDAMGDSAFTSHLVLESLLGRARR